MHTVMDGIVLDTALGKNNLLLIILPQNNIINSKFSNLL